MTAHLKHIIWAVALVAAILGGLAVRGKYEAIVADRMAARDEKIAANQAQVANAQKTVQNAQDSIRATDEETKAKLAQLQVQLASRPDSATVRAIVEASLPGVRTSAGMDSSGQPTISIADTQGNRDAINLATTNAKICNVNLSDCEAKQANYLTIIGAKNAELTADQSTIDLQAKQIKDLGRSQVARWTAMLGVGKTQGSNFRDLNSYQPFLGLDYRLTNRIGVFGAAQNKSAAAGISWHFGDVR